MSFDLSRFTSLFLYLWSLLILILCFYLVWILWLHLIFILSRFGTLCKHLAIMGHITIFEQLILSFDLSRFTSLFLYMWLLLILIMCFYLVWISGLHLILSMSRFRVLG